MKTRKTKLIHDVPSGNQQRALSPRSRRYRVFLLSPANVSGLRGSLLLKDTTRSELADRLRDGGAPLGEIFSFISGLYFRGKLACAPAYADPPPGIPGAVVITASGIRSVAHTTVTLERLRNLCRPMLDYNI